MIYQGSKKRILKDILPIIQGIIDRNGINSYIEPFVGGANVIDSVRCGSRTGSDLNSELIALLRYMRDDPELSIAPCDCDFSHYADVRESRKRKDGRYAQEYISLIGWFASYGGRYYDGGYGRDPSGKRNIYRERLSYAKEQAPLLKGIEFVCKPFWEYGADYKDCLFYCDPPYRDTKVYDGKDGFPYDRFYDWCRETGKRNWVLVSEYSMPDDFECIWSKERKVMQKADRTEADVAVERLYRIGRQDKPRNISIQPDSIFDLI